MSAPMALLSITSVAFAVSVVLRASTDAFAVLLATVVALFTRELRARRAITVLRLLLNARATRRSRIHRALSTAEGPSTPPRP
ncbi:hypothetical protein [Nocardia pseudovaccinii]|uniref:hypothetical protein n=1 Tax=Nocardia pseudovaccinii TaxID=189540 RepID=UPI000AA0B7DB|nr:hypothetical protein [Nocardia pseudovaccinii]